MRYDTVWNGVEKDLLASLSSLKTWCRLDGLVIPNTRLKEK